MTDRPTKVDPFAPARLGSKVLRNRFIKAATFEGMAVDNLVTDRLIEFHRVMAAGGVGMTTLAYTAVSDDGRGAPGEIVVRREAQLGLARLAEAVHAEGAAVSAQLGHAGPVAAGTGETGLAPSRIFSPLAMKFTKAVTNADIERITGDFRSSALVLRDAGFDAIELHLGHNYLLSAFLSPALNKRKDRWGGSVANRAEFPRQVAPRCVTRSGTTWRFSPSSTWPTATPGGSGSTRAWRRRGFWNPTACSTRSSSPAAAP